MHWGLQDSIGHYIDLGSAVLGLAAFFLQEYHSRGDGRAVRKRREG
jgi:hypothetical protein